MNAFTALAVKVVGGGAAAAVLSMGVATGLAQAASPSPSPSSSSPSAQANSDRKADRRAVRLAALEAEADILGIKPEELRKDLKAGQKVSDLAKAKGMTEAQFGAKLIANLKPRLEALVDHKQITQAQADRVLDRIAKGHIPWWNGAHHRR
ncbi:MAG TPA: hypothetical protein VFB69_01215 [Candidatus Dormibacteraeota bacterium]|nr:hypothetical protein [Candidatus Dormibacteraeota bacterium]